MWRGRCTPVFVDDGVHFWMVLGYGSGNFRNGGDVARGEDVVGGLSGRVLWMRIRVSILCGLLL